jgi:hypothetical protein
MSNTGTIVIRRIVIPAGVWLLIFAGGLALWTLFAKEAGIRGNRYETFLSDTRTAEELAKRNGRAAKAELNYFRHIGGGDQYTSVGDILQQFEKTAGNDYLRRVLLRKVPDSTDFGMVNGAIVLELGYDGTFMAIQQAFLNLEKRKENMLLIRFAVDGKDANPSQGNPNPYISATARYLVFVTPDA